MIRTFKVFCALLSYPTEAIRAAVDDFIPALQQENLVSGDLYKGLSRLVSEYQQLDLLDLQERYVLLFDRTRSLSLYLFEHVHGESRDRGQAMVDLQELYAANDLAIDATEIPDYLPLFLEFLSVLTVERALGLLGEPAHVLAALAERLRKRESSYAVVFAALGALAAPADAVVTQALLREVEDDPEDLVALDAAWETEAVQFGPGTPSGGCAQAAQLTNLRQESNFRGVPISVRRDRE